jgi:hypothetical protein
MAFDSGKGVGAVNGARIFEIGAKAFRIER